MPAGSLIPRVLSSVTEEDRALEVGLDRSNLPVTTTLGVLWIVKEDKFTFKTGTGKQNTALTKCALLSKIATLFDPMGFLAPYKIHAKMILQDV